MPPATSKPAFVIGVTGYMDIPEMDRVILRDRLRAIFRWLRQDPRSHQSEGSGATPPAWWPRLESPVPTPGSSHAPTDFELGLGLGDHRIVLLTSLAPGADTIAAQVALDEGIEVVAPLPFPAEIYRHSSSFCGENVAVGAQREFDDLISSTTRAIDAFPVLLHTDQEFDSDTRTATFHSDLTDGERCNLRYRAAGEFVATHCHLLIALYSAADDLARGLETGAGSGSIVHVRRSVPTIRIIPKPDQFPWTECGPVFHLPARSLKRITDPASIEADTSWQETRARLLPPYPADGGSPDPAAQPSATAVAQAASELCAIAHGLAE